MTRTKMMLMTTITRLLLAVTLAGAAAGAVVLTARDARADVCFPGGGGDRRERDSGATDGEVRDGQVLGLRRSLPGGRYAGGALVLAWGLGLAWIGGRRKGARDIKKTAAGPRPPTERSP